MSRKEIYDNKLQIDYFSDSYIRFEEDFQHFSKLKFDVTVIESRKNIRIFRYREQTLMS